MDVATGLRSLHAPADRRRPHQTHLRRRQLRRPSTPFSMSTFPEEAFCTITDAPPDVSAPATAPTRAVPTGPPTPVNINPTPTAMAAPGGDVLPVVVPPVHRRSEGAARGPIAGFQIRVGQGLRAGGVGNVEGAITTGRVGDAAGVSYSNPVLPRTRSSWTPAPRRCCIQSGWSRARNPGRNSATQPCRNHAGLPPGVKVRRRREACRFHQPTRAPPAAHQASMHRVPCSFTPTESDWYEMESDKPRKLPSKEATRGKNSLCKICLKENAQQHK